MRTVITFETDGSLTIIGDSPAVLGEEYAGSSRRASHVEPTGLMLRWAFHLLRAAFGETGRVAGWTRRWKCPWRVNLAPSGGPILGPYGDRAQAISEEVDWLAENLMG